MKGGGIGMVAKYSMLLASVWGSYIESSKPPSTKIGGNSFRPRYLCSPPPCVRT